MTKWTINIKSFILGLVYDKDTVDGMIDGLDEGKADVGHDHDDRYYTQTEVDTALAGKAGLDTATTSANGLMSSTDKTKLDGIESQANKTVVDSSLSSSSENPVQNKVVKGALDNKVDIVAGKGLSTEDYTTAEKTKLAGIESQANKTVVDSSLSSSSENPVQNKVVKDALDDKADATHSHAISDVTDLQTTLNGKVDEADLATVATSGSYDDLSDKPTLADLGGVVTVDKQASAESGYAATYVVKQDGTQVGTKINIPKDYLVKSASLETCEEDDEPVPGYVVGDKYLDFVINTVDSSGTDEHIYILVSDLIDEYSADNTTLVLGQGNVFSVKDGGITRAKLATAVTNELDSKLESDDISVSWDSTNGILEIEVA